MDSERIYVQHFHKVKNYEGLLHEYFDLTEPLELTALDICINLAEMYEEVTFD